MVWSSWQQLRCQPGSWSYIQGLAPLSFSLPEQPVQDLGPQGKVSGGRSRGGGHQERKGHNLPAPGPGQLPTTHRFTPIEPLHFPCVLGKSETGTELLRKDKGGGRGRWPGFSACHSGQLSGGGRTRALEHMCPVPAPPRSWPLWGEVNLGPPGSPSLWGGRWQHQEEGTSH